MRTYLILFLGGLSMMGCARSNAKSLAADKSHAHTVSSAKVDGGVPFEPSLHAQSLFDAGFPRLDAAFGGKDPLQSPTLLATARARSLDRNQNQ